MSIINFPANPTPGQIYTASGKTWIWNSTYNYWQSASPSPYTVTGSDTQIVFNDGGYANSSPGLTFIKSSNTLSVNGSMYISGNIYITGNVTTFAANNLDIVDNMIYLNSNSEFVNPDIGFAANYNDGIYHHTGFFRDHNNGRWKVFENYLPEPQASQYIDQSNQTFRYADFQSNTVYANSISTNTFFTNSIAVTGNGTFSNTSTITIGTGTSNASINSTVFSINGNVLSSNAYDTATYISNNYLYNANLVFTGNVTIQNTLTIGNNSVYTTLSNSNISIGNTTVNTNINTTTININNPSSNAFINTTFIAVGNSSTNAVINTTAFFIGNSSLNAVVNTSSFFIGNSSVNAIINSTSFVYGNSSSRATINTSSIFLGNSTVNTTLLVSGGGGLALGSNVVLSNSSNFNTFASYNYVYNANSLTLQSNSFAAYATVLSSSQTLSGINSLPGVTFAYGNGYGFTIEFYVYFNTLSTTSSLTSFYNSGPSKSVLAFAANTTIISFDQPGYTAQYSPVLQTPLVTNRWYHFAFIGLNNNSYLCIDGVVYDFKGMPSSSASYPYTTSGLATLTNATFSNIRMIANASIYPITGFIPPSLPLNAPPGTVLLINGPAFADYAGNNSSFISTSGSPTIISTVVNTYPTANNLLIAGAVQNGNAFLISISTKYIQTPLFVAYGSNGAYTSTTISNGYITVGNTSTFNYITANNIISSNTTVSNAIVTPVQTLTIALSDETTAITTGNKMTMRAPYGLKLVSPYIRPSLTTAGSSITNIDITAGGTSIFSTTPSLPSGISSNTGPASMSATGLATIADDTQLVFTVTTAGTSAAGLKVNMYYVKV